jgi:hypothetical protein
MGYVMARDAPASAYTQRTGQARFSRAGKDAMTTETTPIGAGESSPAPDGSAYDVSAKYHELLFAVERCFPGESRHETALRYIRETERRVGEAGSCMQNDRLDRQEEAR